MGITGTRFHSVKKESLRYTVLVCPSLHRRVQRLFLFVCLLVFFGVCLIKRFDVELEGTIGDSHAGTLRRRVTL